MDLKKQLANDTALLTYHEAESNAAHKKAEKLDKEIEKFIQRFLKFLPFKEKDVLLNGKELRLFKSCQKVVFKSMDYRDDTRKQIGFQCTWHLMKEGSRWSEREESGVITLNEISSFTILRNNPVSLLEMIER